MCVAYLLCVFHISCGGDGGDMVMVVVGGGAAG